MTTLTYTSQPADGESIDAADINTPLSDISTVMNGNIDADNIADGGVGSREFAPDISTVAITSAQVITGSATDITSLTTNSTVSVTSDVLISGCISLTRTAGTDDAILQLIRGASTVIQTFNLAGSASVKTYSFSWVDTSVAAATVQYKLKLNPASSTFTVSDATNKTQMTALVVKT